MDEQELLAARFEEHRPRLRAVAYRMLGSAAESDDAVQGTWLRLTRADVGDAANLGGWLTTVVARVSLDMLRSRETRREDPWESRLPGPAGGQDVGIEPEEQAELTDSVGLALLVVLDTLSPAERLAFVLHDMFAVPFDEIAPIVELTPAATRQLASGARRRVQGTVPDPGTDMARRREVVGAFLAASRDEDLEALLALLDPDVVLRVDPAAARSGVAGTVGATAVAGTFAGRVSAAQPALIDGLPGAVWTSGGGPRVVIGFTIEAGRIVSIELVAEADHLGRMDLRILDV
ncbi:sigma-70 family RNA polymerase sigma factor [Streptomyces sp. NBC_01724]|uniref:sigma-70 family RNA polymerase sigma factor n=1 Tax=unclassified Streptomyces TaxID=2593676 RepID=UPI002DDA8BFB|nr:MULTISPECIES: sigma-70 family RNA polymerase sigma factor [unclassified Streptomyces]WSC67438.1 sigma-70 family RNA polymerase sigma factor [Streptomyces sp. NBC_01760]WTE49722.1 sigma-70 family RNA polymerase sigma factor [Streptomyces sp. NBC_01620]WTE57808.1 sigma-70 family RNA polymerase sigma factor [Streptomyces sp. NBC_01617]WTI85323.1 sigma-70 family RNA polymerase sigma factor [Streptomyces sp. NBC_00724]